MYWVGKGKVANHGSFEVTVCQTTTLKKQTGPKLSHQRQIYSPPDKIKTNSAHIPTNCGEPKDAIWNLSQLRDAYRRATAYVDEEPYNNCCTIKA